MNTYFGPWSTAIATGAPFQLNSFWKRRLAMLPSLSQTTSRTTRRTLLMLLALGVAVIALPTIRWAAQAQSAGSAALYADDFAQAASSTKAARGDRHEKPVSESKAQGALEVEFLPRPSKFEEQVLAALEKPTTVDFQDLSLEDAIAYLGEYHGINIWLDKPTLTDEGVALDQPVTLRLKDARLESVLNLLLKPAQLTFLPENDVMAITTATKAGHSLITRTYPVRDLYQGRVDADVAPAQKDDKAALDAPPAHGIASIASCELMEFSQVSDGVRQLGGTRFDREIDNQIAQGFGGGGQPAGQGGAAAPAKKSQPKKYADLVDAITSTIEPDSWENLSGPGTYTYVKETGCLVIRQTWAIHRQILQLLRDLREAQHLAPGGKARPPAVDGK
jgi:hypothetical protein